MADLDTIVLMLDRIIVSGELMVGSAHVVARQITLRQLLDRIAELYAPATIAVREALERAAASDQEHDSVVVSDAAALVAARHFRDGDLAGAQKLILDDLAYQHGKRAGLEAPTYEGAPSVDLNTRKAWNLSAWTRGEPVVRLELDERTAPASVMRGHTCKGCGATASSKWKFYANVTGAWCALCNPNPENTRRAPDPSGDNDIS